MPVELPVRIIAIRAVAIWIRVNISLISISIRICHPIAVS
jgi:hypothetical protein